MKWLGALGMVRLDILAEIDSIHIHKNMTFSIKRIGNYHDVDVTLDNTQVALGLLDKEQAMDLAKTFKQAIDDLLEKDEYNQLMGIEQ